MSKPKFDLELFWSLPRGRGRLVNDKGEYCAMGAAYKSLGWADDEIKKYGMFSQLVLEKELEHPPTVSFEGMGITQKPWVLNDHGHIDAAKRRIIETLLETGAVEFTEDPLTFKIEEAANLKERVEVGS